jgi:thiamine biosynthesis lipoprotein
MTRRAGFATTAVLAAVFAAVASADAAVARRGSPVMGTVLTVTVVADTPEIAVRLADEAIEECRRWEDALTIWRDDGELARFNAKAGTGRVGTSRRLHAGLVAMRAMAVETGGAFEPGVGRLRSVTHLGGLGIVRVLAIDAEHATLARGAALDPGGIGKGLALDAAVLGLRHGGARAAFLDFGGSSQSAFGVPPGDASGWKVELSTLTDKGDRQVVTLRDESLSTSRAGADDTTPILDPRNSRPVPAPRLVTVRAKDAGRADAWSTALVVLGPDALASATAHRVEAVVETSAGRVPTPGFFDSAPSPE